MTRTHGGPLIIPAEKQSYPISPRVIKYSPGADRGGRGTGGGWGRVKKRKRAREITDFYLCKPVSLADHV